MKSGGKRLGGEGLWHPQGMWADGKGGLQLGFCCSTMEKLEALGLEDQNEWRRSVSKLPLFIGLCAHIYSNTMLY